MESMKDFEEEINRSFRKFSEGDIVKGTVLAVAEEEVEAAEAAEAEAVEESDAEGSAGTSEN